MMDYAAIAAKVREMGRDLPQRNMTSDELELWRVKAALEAAGVDDDYEDLMFRYRAVCDTAKTNAQENIALRAAVENLKKRLQAAEAEAKRLRPVYAAYQELLQLKQSMIDCPKCVEARCHGGAGCRSHLIALTAADCKLHNAANEVRLYEEAQRASEEAVTR